MKVGTEKNFIFLRRGNCLYRFYEGSIISHGCVSDCDQATIKSNPGNGFIKTIFCLEDGIHIGNMSYEVLGVLKIQYLNEYFMLLLLFRHWQCV